MCLCSCLSHAACKSHTLCPVSCSHLWAAWLYHIFPFYSTDCRVLGEKATEHTWVFSEHNFCLRHFSFKRIQRGIIINVHRLSCKGRPGQLSRYSDSLRDGRSWDRNPVKRIFRTNPNRPWGHPASCTTGTGSLVEANRPRHGVNTDPCLAPRPKKEQNYTSTRPLGLHGPL